VIVPARNAENTIDLCLRSLVKQDFTRMEIIVVDNMSTDRTKEKVTKYPVTLIEERRVNSYVARNAGFRRASGEVVAFLDADCIATPKWVNFLISNYSDNKVGGVGGQIIPYTKHKPRGVVERYTISARCYPAYPYDTREPMVLQRRKGILLAGVLFTANASYRKSVLEQLGGFDETSRSGGDIDMSYRVQDFGCKLVWDPRAIVYHVQRSTTKDLIRQYFRYGTCVAPLVRKHFEDQRYFIVQHYRDIVKNALVFLFRLVLSPFHRNDKALYLTTPVLDNLTLVALIIGKFYGNLRVRVFIV